MVTSRFIWPDGRCVEQVTYADASGLHVEYCVNGLVIATSVPLPEIHSPAMFTPAVNMGETVNVPEEQPVADPLIPPVPPDDSVAGGITASVSAPSRLKAANIRGMWAGVFGGIASAGSEGITYALNHLTTLEIPQGLLFVIGVGLTSALTGSQYWAKKLAKPDGTW